MEPHLVSRPIKMPFDPQEQGRLRDLAIRKIKEMFLPDEDIVKIILIGSSVKGTFGKYEPPGFRGSLFSDFDFIIFVRNGYHIPNSLKGEPDGRLFQDEKLDLAYRKGKVVEGIFDFEIFFVRESAMNDPDIIERGEAAGIPMRESTTQNKFVIVYP
jgi:predicted nucleotidyltransferase